MSASVRVMTWARSLLASSSSPRARNASARRRRAYTQDIKAKERPFTLSSGKEKP
jgi:hypothetical protein